MSRRQMRDAIAQVKPNIIDRVIGVFAPKAALERQRARLTMALVGSYTGASKSKRSLSQWSTTGGSADADTLFDLPALRERSRDLVRNEPIAGGAIHTVVTKTIGTGLAMQPRVRHELLSMTLEQAQEWEANAKTRFEAWGASKDCDIARTQNFYETQDLAFRSTLENGDVFCLMPRAKRRGRDSLLTLQLIEADRCSNQNRKADTTTIAGGIEQDATGAPKSYFFSKTHPGDINKTAIEWDTVPAFGAKSGRRNVIHLYRKLRVGQRRGVPYLAPVIETLKQMSRYADAEIMAAVVSSMFTVFVKSEDGAGLDPVTDLGGETGATSSDKDVKMAPGAIIDLAPGESIESANPGRPNPNFEPFFLAFCTQIGVALELPREVLLKQFNSSYSAARASLLDAWLFIRTRRDWIASNFCQPIYEAWLEEEIAYGRIEAPGFFNDEITRFAWCGAEWVGDGPGSIDPVKEVTAAEKRLNLKISTVEKEAMLHDGGDWRANIRQRGLEEEESRKAGLASPPDPTKKPAAKPAPQNGDAAPEQDDEENPPVPGQGERAIEALIAQARKPAPAAHIHVARPATPWLFEVDPEGRTVATPLEGAEP